MTRATDIMLDRKVKNKWPGNPELEIEAIQVSRSEGETSFFATKDIIVSAISDSGETWEGTEPPRIPGWTVLD